VKAGLEYVTPAVAAENKGENAFAEQAYLSGRRSRFLGRGT
jgi:hypothetical protein